MALRKQEGGLLLFSIVLSAFLMAHESKTGHQPYFSFVVLIPIFVALRVCVAWQGAACGAVWGLTLIVLSLAGLGPPIVLSPVAVITAILIPAAYVGFGCLLTTRIGFHPLALAVGWMLVEAALSPTGTLNHGKLVDRTWMSWFGTMVAPWLVGFCIALINAELILLAATCFSQGARLPSRIRRSQEAYFFEFPQLIRIACGTKTQLARGPPSQ